MLSHLVGAANRKALRTLKELDCRCSALKEELNAAGTLFRERISEREAAIDDLKSGGCPV